MSGSDQVPEQIRCIGDRLQRLDMWNEQACVYFLVRSGVVVYVGQSRLVGARIMQHRQARKVFDSVYSLPCSKDDMSDLEAALIQKLKPELNSMVPSVTDDRAKHLLKKYKCTDVPRADECLAPALCDTAAIRQLFRLLAQHGNQGMTAEEISEIANHEHHLRRLITASFNGWPSPTTVKHALRGRLAQVIVDGKQIQPRVFRDSRGRPREVWVVANKERTDAAL